MVICLEQGADLHMAQLMLLPLTASCFSKIQIGFTFLVPAHPGSPGKRAVKRVCVGVYTSTFIRKKTVNLLVTGLQDFWFTFLFQCALISILASPSTEHLFFSISAQHIIIINI